MACKDAQESGGLNPVPLDQRRAPPVRIVLVSTPRSGNNWLRHLLARLYDIPSLSVHNPADLDWAALPPHCVFGDSQLLHRGLHGRVEAGRVCRIAGGRGQAARAAIARAPLKDRRARRGIEAEPWIVQTPPTLCSAMKYEPIRAY